MEVMKMDKKVRLSVDCTPEERMYIKMLAARNHMTISDYMISLARLEMPSRHKVLNDETEKTLKDTDLGIGLTSCKDLDDFWNKMGINTNDFAD
jgi:hypothetical protein